MIFSRTWAVECGWSRRGPGAAFLFSSQLFFHMPSNPKRFLSWDSCPNRTDSAAWLRTGDQLMPVLLSEAGLTLYAVRLGFRQEINHMTVKLPDASWSGGHLLTEYLLWILWLTNLPGHHISSACLVLSHTTIYFFSMVPWEELLEGVSGENVGGDGGE